MQICLQTVDISQGVKAVSEPPNSPNLNNQPTPQNPREAQGIPHLCSSVTVNAVSRPPCDVAPDLQSLLRPSLMQDHPANSSQQARMDAAACGAGSRSLGWGQGLGLPACLAWLLSCCAVKCRALNTACFHWPPSGKHAAGQQVWKTPCPDGIEMHSS